MGVVGVEGEGGFCLRGANTVPSHKCNKNESSDGAERRPENLSPDLHANTRHAENLFLLLFLFPLHKRGCATIRTLLCP